MKKYIKYLSAFILLIILTGCSSENGLYFNYDSKKYITLYDYKNIRIEKSYTEVSDKDIETIINLDLSSNEVYKEIKDRNIVKDEDIILIDATSNNSNINFCNYYYELGSGEISAEFDNMIVGKVSGNSYTISIGEADSKINIELHIKGIFSFPTITDIDIICNFYKCENLESVKEYLKKRAYNEIVFNYMWDIIVSSSHIDKIPACIKQKINYNIDAAYADSEDVEKEEIIQNINDFYYEIMIGKAILDSEKININQEKIDKTIDELALNMGITKDLIYDYYSQDDIFYQAVMKEIMPILVSYAIIT